MGLRTRGLGDAGTWDAGTRGRSDAGTRGRGDSGMRGRGDVGLENVGTRDVVLEDVINKQHLIFVLNFKVQFSVLSRKILYLSFSS